MKRAGKKDCACPRARHVHGTPAGYSVCGCGCLRCRVAYCEQLADRRAGRRDGVVRTWPFVSNVGVRRRIEALHATGWTAKELAARLGVSHQQVHRLRVLDRPVMPTTTERIAALYDALWDVPPPSATSGERHARNYIRNLAARNGWAPPLAWDDESLDDPNGLPVLDVVDMAFVDDIAVEEAMRGRPVTLTRTEHREAVRRLTEAGYSTSEIARLLRTNERDVQRRRAETRKDAA